MYNAYACAWCARIRQQSRRRRRIWCSRRRCLRQQHQQQQQQPSSTAAKAPGCLRVSVDSSASFCRCVMIKALVRHRGAAVAVITITALTCSIADAPHCISASIHFGATSLRAAWMPESAINRTVTKLQYRKEAQLSRRDCAMRYVVWNLVNCCTTYEKYIWKGAIGEWPWRSFKVIGNGVIR